MTKTEARSYLGVSSRTLDRYLKSERLPSRLAVVDGREVRVMDEADVVALKTALDAARAERAGRVIAPSAMQHLSFRMEPDYLQLLAEEAVRRRLKPTECARILLVEALGSRVRAEAQYAELLAGQEELRRELEQLRRDSAQMVYQVLVQAVKANPKQAKAWVQDVFGQ